MPPCTLDPAMLVDLAADLDQVFMSGFVLGFVTGLASVALVLLIVRFREAV